MKRTKKEFNVDAILCGDFHLQEGNPLCRMDDFETAQWHKLNFIKRLQKKYDCEVWHSGDLFDHWKPSPSLLSKTIETLPDKFYTIYGNHDLPQHNLELAYRSGIYTLKKAGALQVFESGHWNTSIACTLNIKNKRVAIWHVMTYQGVNPWPNCTDSPAVSLLRKNIDKDLILTGHNHKPFVEEHKGRLLVNPGSLTRTTADQFDFKPRVYLYDAEQNKVKPVFLPIENNVISREHIEKKEEKNNRIDAFISKLNDDYDIGLNFKNNITQFEQQNTVRKSVMDIIYKSMETV